MQKRGRFLSGLLALILLLTPLRALAADDSFFEDAVFLGDSITVGLEKYVKSKRESGACLSNAQFLATNGYMVSHTGDADGYEKHPLYDGARVQPHKAIRKIEPKRVFILMGINDAAGEVSTLLDNYASMLSRVRDASGAEVYMLAVFPMCTAKEDGKRNNAKIETINDGLLRLAMREGVSFIDLTPALENERGALTSGYSSDNYVHISNDGYDVYISQLRKAASFFKKSGSNGEATVINVQKYVNARSEPSTKGKLVTTIKKGKTVEVLERDGDWCRISYDGQELYVAAKYISGGSGLSGTVVNVSSFANLRALPDEEAELKGTAEKGVRLEISQSYYDPGWYRVIVDGKAAYISKDYLEMN